MAIKVLSNMEAGQITVPFPASSSSAINAGYYELFTSSFANLTIAPMYNEGRQYSVGDVVTRAGILYRCFQSTTGEFDSTKWNQTTIISSNGKIPTDLLPTSYSSLSVTSFTVSTSLYVPVTPTANNHAASKKYVDDQMLGAGSLLKYKRTITFPMNTTYSTANSAYTLPAIGDDYIGWHLSCTGSANTTVSYTYYLKLSNVTFAETASDSFGKTYEIVIIARKKSNSTTGKVTFHIIDSGNTEIAWLGDAPEDLERGFAYFLVLRSFAYGVSSTGYAHKWVGNIQGKIPIPYES